MIPIQSEIEGKEAVFGDIEQPFQQQGFSLGGNWEYDGGYFDTELERDGGETIYLRLPVQVVDGELDDAGARIKFLEPLLVRHVVNTGITHDDSIPLADQMPLATNHLVNQFQTPLETDGEIQRVEERKAKAKSAIDKILPYLH